jgi:hypothetical protein
MLGLYVETPLLNSGVVVLVMVKFHEGVLERGLPAGMVMKPESKPPLAGWQGFAKEDWVTVWLEALHGKAFRMV